MPKYPVLLFLFCCVFCVFGADVVSVSVKEGYSVTLNFTKQQHEPMQCYFNSTRIALINGEASKSCLYDGEGGRFRDRLKVDYESGSLIISDIRSEHTGRYECEIIRSKSTGTNKSLNRNRTCEPTKIITKTSNTPDTITFNVTVTAETEHKDPDKTNEESDKKKMEQEHGKSSALSAAAVTGIVVAVAVVAVLLVFAVVAVIYCRHRKKGSVFRSSYRNSSADAGTVCHTGDLEKGNQEVLLNTQEGG